MTKLDISYCVEQGWISFPQVAGPVHSDKRAAYQAAYRQRHRQQALAYQRAYRARHKEQQHAQVDVR